MTNSGGLGYEAGSHVPGAPDSGSGAGMTVGRGYGELTGRRGSVTLRRAPASNDRWPGPELCVELGLPIADMRYVDERRTNGWEGADRSRADGPR